MTSLLVSKQPHLVTFYIESRVCRAAPNAQMSLLELFLSVAFCHHVTTVDFTVTVHTVLQADLFLHRLKWSTTESDGAHKWECCCLG